MSWPEVKLIVDRLACDSRPMPCAVIWNVTSASAHATHGNARWRIQPG